MPFTIGFKYKMLETVEIVVSGEKGEIVACASYANAENQYLIRYCAGDGRAVESWWSESALRGEFE